MNRKNYIAISCALLCGISLCACASAPSTSAVVPKNAERLANQATDSSASQMPFLTIRLIMNPMIKPSLSMPIPL